MKSIFPFFEKPWRFIISFLKKLEKFGHKMINIFENYFSEFTKLNSNQKISKNFTFFIL